MANKREVVDNNKHSEIQRVESECQPSQPQSADEAWKSSSWVSYDKICRQHEFSVEVVSGSAQSCFKFTKIVHIKDKYIIENRTGEVLDVRAPVYNLQEATPSFCCEVSAVFSPSFRPTLILFLWFNLEVGFEYASSVHTDHQFTRHAC